MIELEDRLQAVGRRLGRQRVDPAPGDHGVTGAADRLLFSLARDFLPRSGVGRRLLLHRTPDEDETLAGVPRAEIMMKYERK